MLDPDHELAGVRHEQAFHLKSFLGREALLARIDAWITSPSSGALLLSGGPGAGKSAIAARVAQQHGALLHLIKSHKNPRRFLPSLVTQAARAAGARFGAEAYSGDIDDLRDALVRALAAVQAATGSALLIIDALDELDPADQRLGFLPAALPEGVRLIVTARPDIPLIAALRARFADLEQWEVPPLGERDAASIIARKLSGITGADRVDAGAVSARAGGNPLLVTRAAAVLARDLAGGGAPRIEALPASIAEVFEGIYREIADKDGARPPSEVGEQKARLLQLLAVAREPLGIAELSLLAEAHALPRSPDTLRDLLVGASRFLADAAGRYEPWHRGLTDHVRERVLGESGVRRIEEAITRVLATPEAARSGYALRHRVAHLLSLDRAADAADLLLDGALLEAKAEAGLVFDLVAELSDVTLALPIDAPARPVLDLIGRALRREAHFLARHPGALFQTVHEAAAADGEAAEVGAWLTRFREQKRAREPGFAWITALRPAPVGAGRTLLAALRGHEREVLAVAVAPGGARVASASEDGTVRVWDRKSGGARLVLRASDKRALSVAFSPDGRHLAAGTDEGRVRLWDAEGGAEIGDLRGHEGPVWALAFAPDGARIASGGRDRRVLVRDRDGREAWRADVEGVITALSISPDGERLAAALSSAAVEVWRLADGAPITRYADLDDAAWSVDFSPDGSRLLVASADGSVRVLGAAYEVVAELFLPDERLWTAAFSPDGKHIALGGTGKRAYRWTPGSDAPPMSLPAHGGWVDAVAFSPDGELLVTGAADGAVRLFDVRDLSAGGRRSPGPSVSVAAFGSSGRHVGVGHHDGHVEIWSAESGAVERSIAAHTKVVTALAFSPDDRLIASASRDGTAALHRLDGRSLGRLVGHEGAVGCVAVSADGARVVTGSSDETVRLWSIFGARETHRFEHGGPVSALGISRDGQRLAAVDRAGELRLWDVPGKALRSRVALSGSASTRASEPDVAGLVFSPDGARVHVITRSGARSCWSGDTGAPAQGQPGDLPEPEARAVERAGETEIRRVEGDVAMAWYPASYPHLRASPAGRAWVAWDAYHVCLMALRYG